MTSTRTREITALPSADLTQAQAHTGLADGHRWSMPADAHPPTLLRLPLGAADSWQYRLVLHPRTQRPVHDGHGRLVYLPTPDRATRRR